MSKSILSSLKGSTNVITGCGSGLGKATLQWFLRKECGPVLGIDRLIKDDFLESLNLNEEQKGKLLLKQHDTFDEVRVESSLKEFVTKHGRIDNLINIAGVALAYVLFARSKKTVYSLQHSHDLTQFNTVGTFNMIRSASRFMIDNDRPKCIVNASCISTTKPSIGQTFYAGSKSAIDSMTLCIARELSPFNIRCNTINIGYFDTWLLNSSDEKIISYIEDEVVLCPKRLGHPDEFAHLVEAVIENKMLNGACIKLDGGTDTAFDRGGGKSGI